MSFSLDCSVMDFSCLSEKASLAYENKKPNDLIQHPSFPSASYLCDFVSAPLHLYQQKNIPLLATPTPVCQGEAL